MITKWIGLRKDHHMDQQGLLDLVNEKRFEDLESAQREALGENNITILAANPLEFSTYQDLTSFLVTLDGVDHSTLADLTEKARLPPKTPVETKADGMAPFLPPFFSGRTNEDSRAIQSLRDTQEKTNQLLEEILSRLQ